MVETLLDTLEWPSFVLIAISIGDKDSVAPPIAPPYEALDLLMAVVKKAGQPWKVQFDIDPASRGFFFKNDNFDLGFEWKELQPPYTVNLSRNTQSSSWKVCQHKTTRTHG